jgi:tubulin--tyrosine ligase
MIKRKLFPYRFHFQEKQSPTYANLHHHLKMAGWTSSRIPWLSHFSEKNFQFHSTAAETLEYKHLLAKLVASYCPDVMPESYYINDINWSAVLSDIAEKYYLQNNRMLDHVPDIVWILKPALLNNGQHIRIFQQLSQIEEHYLGANRLGGDHVLQRYITQPHLLNGNKYSIRMFVILTNYAGTYLYPRGYFNVGLHSYTSDYHDLKAHLTNEHLNDVKSNVIQVPTEDFAYLFSPLFQKIKDIITAVIDGLQQHYPEAFTCSWRNKRTLAIFGFDFMVDTDMRVWLLEANHGPCFPTHAAHPLQQKLYYPFWQDFIKDFVYPIAV